MEVGHRKDDDVPTKVPIEWKETARKESSGASLLDLKIKTTTKLSWPGSMGKENQVITNYILNAEGMWKGKAIIGKGTIENWMHRVIQ